MPPGQSNPTDAVTSNAREGAEKSSRTGANRPWLAAGQNSRTHGGCSFGASAATKRPTGTLYPDALDTHPSAATRHPLMALLWYAELAPRAAISFATVGCL